MYLLIYSLFLLFSLFRIFQGWLSGSAVDAFSNFGFFVTIFAIIISTDIFSSLRSTGSGIFYLMLPATTVEKFLAALLYSTIFTFILYLATFAFVELIVVLIGNLVSTTQVAFYFPDIERILKILSGMLFFQSIYFLGSVYFRKNPLGKTTVALFIAGVIISIIFSIIIKNRLLGFGPFPSGSHTYSFEGNFDENMFPFSYGGLEVFAKTIFYIIPVLCWTGAYIKLKKSQI